jgi:hypothetical protein
MDFPEELGHVVCKTPLGLVGNAIVDSTVHNAANGPMHERHAATHSFKKWWPMIIALRSIGGPLRVQNS